MPSQRERALEAAVDLVGSQGLRALTHARIDVRAGLPRGSTSNYFRTRAALLEAVVTWVSERELAEVSFDPAAFTPSGLVDALCAGIEVQTGERRTRTMARYVLFLESAHDPDLRAPLVANRHRFEAFVEQVLTALGAPEPVVAARTLMACAEGLVLHRMTVDPEVELRPVVAAVVSGVLAGVLGGAQI